MRRQSTLIERTINLLIAHHRVNIQQILLSKQLTFMVHICICHDYQNIQHIHIFIAY